MNLVNVNNFGKENIDLLNEREDNRELTKGERLLIDEINSFKPETILEYPCKNGRLLKELPSEGRGIYRGADYRRRYIDTAKERFSDNKPYNPNAKFTFIDVINNKNYRKEVDILVIRDHLQSELNPVEFLNRVQEKIKAKKIIVTIQYPKEHGQELGSNPKCFGLSNGSRFINFEYSEDAVRRIALDTGFDIILLEDEEGRFNSAVLLKEQVEVKPIVEEVKQEKIEKVVSKSPAKKKKKIIKSKKGE